MNENYVSSRSHHACYKRTNRLSAAVKQPEIVITGQLTLLFAIAVGVIVTSLFAPQTLVGLIGPSLGLTAAAGGFVAMVTLLGYAGGLFLLVPLADLSKIVDWFYISPAAIMAAAGATLIPTAAFLLAVLFYSRRACSAIQILVPLAATNGTARPARSRNRRCDGGLMNGILLSRPLPFIADVSSWRASTASAPLSWLLTAFSPGICPSVAGGASRLRCVSRLAWHLRVPSCTAPQGR